MIYKFTTRAKKAIELAQEEAINLGHNYVGSEHILYGLAKEGAGVASRVLNNQDVECEDIENKIIEMIGKKRGVLGARGNVKSERASALLIDEFRAGKIGKVILDCL